MMAAAYRLHFRAFAKTAARDAFRAAIEAEAVPDSIAAFFAWRFEDQCQRFAGSFADLWRIDPAFREATQAMRGRPGAAP
jgi:hypothetical protein